MTIVHHPSDATLAAFATGALDEARSAVVATHIHGCPACRRVARGFQHAAGVALADGAPVPLAADALQRALGAIGSGDAASADPVPRGRAAGSPLDAYEWGAWRWIGPGVHWRSSTLPRAAESRLFMLRAAPGTALPHHRHSGIEWTCVIEGAFRHQHGRYGAGDFDEADETVEHHPVVEEGVACVCVVALQGQILFKSWVGRLIQPLVSI